MKRIIYLLAISCFLLISCHDDDRFSVENVVGNNTSIVGMWLREAGKEQQQEGFANGVCAPIVEFQTGYEKTTDRRNNTVSVDGFTYEFDPNTMSIVFDKEFDNAIYSEWTVEMKGKSYMILTHHGIWDAGHGLTHEDTYSFELFRIMDE